MNIFIFPCSDPAAYSHYTKTIKNSIDIANLRNISRQTKDYITTQIGNQFKVWGIIPGKMVTKLWDTIRENDLCVFYKEKKLIATAKVQYKFRNQELARSLWGESSDNTWELLVFLSDYTELNDIPSTKSDGEELTYRRFSKVSDKFKPRILNLIGQSESSSVTNSSVSHSQSSIYTTIDTALKTHKQIVLTGAPGTGKTYCAKKYVENKTNNDSTKYKFVQFHQSYDYSDFIEGLRPVVLNDASCDPTFVKVEGDFKAFCRTIVMNNYQAYAKHKIKNIDFETFKDDYTKIEKKMNTGKYGEKYYFIIDEVNRADLSKVFGELMYSLEKSHRGIDHTIKTQYAQLTSHKIEKDGSPKKSWEYFDCFKEGFFIPTNLYIICTMNDIDKSVEAFDFALRRRFEWIEISAKTVVKESLEEMLVGSSSEQIESLVQKINRLNDIISTEGKVFGLSDSYHIGHAYFKNIDLNDPNSIENIFSHKIVPLLKEYTRGRDRSAIGSFIQKCANALEVTYS